jgi:Holliday junction resolvase
MSSSQYERELKYILEGEVKTISKITKTCSVLERNNYRLICKKPFAVIRAAGSFGIDLVATRGDISFLIEVKTSINNIIHFSSMGGKPQKQAEAMIRICKRTETLPIYAFRTKNRHGDSWKIFTLGFDGLKGKQKLIHNRLPKIKESNSGNLIMKWDEGMSLSDFISYLCK